MKKLLLSISCIALCSLSTAQDISDNFDSYTTGGYLAAQSNGVWTTWTNLPGTDEDTQISSDYAYSGANSAVFATGGSTDIVLPLGAQNSNAWNLSFMMYIPSSYGAYFNMLHEFGQVNNWAFDVFFSATGEGTLHMGGSNSGQTQTFNFAHDQWFSVSVDIDVDADDVTCTVDGSAMNWVWSTASGDPSTQIAALNLYAYAPSGENGLYYIDDVTFQLTDIGIEELDNLAQVYPNPATNNLTIDLNKNEVCDLEIYSLLGHSIYAEELNNASKTIDCSDWTPGVYFLQITDFSGSVQHTKFIVE
jgi:hypothetical protein